MGDSIDGCLAALSAHTPGLSEGIKGCVQVAESVYFAAHHDGNTILRFDNHSTRIIAGSELGEPGDGDGFGLNTRLRGPQGIVYDQNRTVY